MAGPDKTWTRGDRRNRQLSSKQRGLEGEDAADKTPTAEGKNWRRRSHCGPYIQKKFVRKSKGRVTPWESSEIRRVHPSVANPRDSSTIYYH